MLGLVKSTIWRLKRIRSAWLGRDLIPWQDASVTFVGSQYGGAYLSLSAIDSNSVVYSVGVGEDISLDEELIRRTGCTVVGIDPTPRAKEFVQQRKQQGLSENYSFLEAGLATESGTQRFYFPADAAHVSMSLVHDTGNGYIDATFLSLDDLMARLGHDWVDLIKVDIEGEEYSLFESWLQSGYRPPAGQIWVELHPQRAERSAIDTVGLARRMTALGFIPVCDGDAGVLFINALSDRLQIVPCVLGGKLGLQAVPQARGADQPSATSRAA